MFPRALQFRRFSHRLLALFVGLLFAALATTYLIVSRTNDTSARERARANLEAAARTVDFTVRQRLDFLAASAAVMSGDDALKQVLRTGDNRTLGSALRSYTLRTGAPVIAFHDADGQFLANSDPGMDHENEHTFRYLIREAIANDLPQHSGYSYLKGELHALIVVPLYAPYPNIFGWFGLAFPIDRAFAWKIRDTTGVELTYVATDRPALASPTGAPLPLIRPLATTLAPAATSRVVAAAAAATAAFLRRESRDLIELVDLPGDYYVTLYKFQEILAESPVTLALSRPLAPELKSADDLKNALILTSLAALATATFLALFIARSVSQPVVALVGHTQRIARGDYSVRNTTYRPDELGRLSAAFDDMARGLSERDRVRDLLDKNVSPEVAAALLRDGAILGGQEREVTILFADLRGFTTLSEKLTPHELLTLLNRYLDRMSAAIEAHGGVIDKFIGDAIMALFGAPVAQPDAADRALAAALAMEKALVQLNAELAAEGIAPLAIGIGVNTARVVAGNIGSHRRLNYSVIGDGVNVASRLQSLTRTAEYRTNLITSAATLAACRPPPSDLRSPNPDLPSPISQLPTPAFRPLGRVSVKGRAEPVEIFAVE